MKIEPYAREARMEDAFIIAPYLRAADVMEVFAQTGESPLRPLVRSYKLSTVSYTVIINDEPAMMFGVSPVSVVSGVGSPWMLATDAIEQIGFRFVRRSRDYVAEFHEYYPKLINRVDIRNSLSIKWLKWLGFSIHPAVNSGLHGELFHPFERVA